MLMTEFNLEDALAVRYAESIEEGIEKGREEGREEGYGVVFELLDQGLSIDEIKQRLGNRANV